jgi:SGNH domain (fused to AT3 domains)
LIVGAVSCCVLVAVLTLPGTSGASHLDQAASLARVLRLVAAAPTIKKIPHNLAVPLQDTPNDNAYRLVLAQRCGLGPDGVTLPSCVYGDPRGTRTMVLFGDSHAEMWLPGFDAMAKRAHWKLIFLAKPGCPAAYIQTYDPFRKKYPFKECDEWHAYAVSRINRTRPDLLVLSDEFVTPRDKNYRVISDSVWTAGLERTLHLIAHGTRKVILGDIGYLPQSAPDCLAAHESDVRACSAAAKTAVLADHLQAEHTAATAAHAGYVRVIPWFCSAVCTPIIGNMVVYFDQFHITSTYSVFLSGVLRTALRRFMAPPVS